MLYIVQYSIYSIGCTVTNSMLSMVYHRTSCLTMIFGVYTSVTLLVSGLRFHLSSMLRLRMRYRAPQSSESQMPCKQIQVHPCRSMRCNTEKRHYGFKAAKNGLAQLQCSKYVLYILFVSPLQPALFPSSPCTDGFHVLIIGPTAGQGTRQSPTGQESPTEQGQGRVSKRANTPPC